MKISKSRIFLLSVFCLSIFLTANAYGDSYNHYALEAFKRSLEYLITGDYDNAIASCNDVLRRDPNSAVSLTIRARAYYEKGDMSKAIADSTQAIRLDRNNIGAYTIRASAYARTDNLDRAISDWQAILRINPENADAIHNIEMTQNAQ